MNTERDRAVKLIEEKGSFTMLARGPSMHPVIRDGDVLTITCVPPGRLRVGQIVLHENEGRLLAHCVARIDRDDAGSPIAVLLRGTCGSGPLYNTGTEGLLGLVVSARRSGRDIPTNSLPRRVAALLRVRVLARMRRRRARDEEEPLTAFERD